MLKGVPQDKFPKDLQWGWGRACICWLCCVLFPWKTQSVMSDYNKTAVMANGCLLISLSGQRHSLGEVVWHPLTQLLIREPMA